MLCLQSAWEASVFAKHSAKTQLTETINCNLYPKYMLPRILDLQESGEIKKLKKKYWTKSSKCGLNNEGTTTKAAERTLEVSSILGRV